MQLSAIKLNAIKLGFGTGNQTKCESTLKCNFWLNTPIVWHILSD